MSYDPDKPRIFQIGFNKCGTRSFHKFLKANKIKSAHFNRGDLAVRITENIEMNRPPLTNIDRWVGYSDMQTITRSVAIEAFRHFKAFAKYYPRSYFILNTRSKDRWIQSRLRHGKHQSYANRYRGALGLKTISETVDVWSEMWDAHHAEAQQFFSSSDHPFLVYNIETDTPDKISEFLAPDFSTDPLLYGHMGKTTQKSDATEKLQLHHVDSNSSIDIRKLDFAIEVRNRLADRLLPHNNLQKLDETVPLANLEEMKAPKLIGDSTGNVIVACMKNEGPFLLEWVAYHRSIGIHNFLIYSNESEDGTEAILDELHKDGIVTHVNNDNWSGKSPQASALKSAVNHPMVLNADWIIHIDADEFINIRTEDGTFSSLVKAVPKETTNIAMTWRLFGSAGVADYEDNLVLEQFDRCAPSFLPKPNTAWGFKTATRNIGAYRKLSSHRPTSLDSDAQEKVHWVNGSGEDITSSRSRNGWRSNVNTIGYDLVQLNHYPLRSAQSFLVKHQRGSGLREDQPIGKSYWLRMDWNTYQDVSIKRNIPRLIAELDRIKQNKKIHDLHNEAVFWHLKRVSDLKKKPELRKLLDDCLATNLSDLERIVEVLDQGTS